MKKELIIAIVCAVLGSASTVGFDILKSKYIPSDDPLSQGVTELTHISKELILEQKSLNSRIASIVKNPDIPSSLLVEFEDVVNRVNNIVKTSLEVESQTRDVTGLALALKSRNVNVSYNPNADLILSYGQAVTVCGNENTLGIEKEVGSDTAIYINNNKRYPSIGQEFIFESPMGTSLVSYLGKYAEQYQFRIVCGTTVKK
ncbi:hypothetical protein ACW5WN_13420 [Aeromonas lacus]